jgi:hypothetical protein
VLHQADAADHAFRVGRDHDVDRLAGIAGGVGDVGVQPDMAEQPVARVGRREGRLALRRAEPVGAREDLGRRDAAEEFREPRRLRAGGPEAQQQQQQRGEEDNAAARRAPTPWHHPRGTGSQWTDQNEPASGNAAALNAHGPAAL